MPSIYLEDENNKYYSLDLISGSKSKEKTDAKEFDINDDENAIYQVYEVPTEVIENNKINLVFSDFSVKQIQEKIYSYIIK